MLLFLKIISIVAIIGVEAIYDEHVYKMKLAFKSNKIDVLNICVRGTQPFSEQFPVYPSEVSYFGNLKSYLDYDICDSVNITDCGDDEIALMQASEFCDYQALLTNYTYVKNLKAILVLLPDYEQLPQELLDYNDDPFIVLVKQDIFLEALQNQPIEKFQVGFYHDIEKHWTMPLYSAIIFLHIEIAVAVILICLISHLYNREILQSVNSISKVHKYLCYLHVILIAIISSYIFSLYSNHGELFHVIICSVIGTHSLIFFCSILLRNKSFLINMVRKNNSFDNKYCTKLDLRLIVPLIFGMVLTFLWIFMESEIIGFFCSLIFGLFICLEISIIFAILFNLNSQYSKILVLYGIAFFVHMTVIVVIGLMSNTIETYLTNSSITTNNFLWHQNCTSFRYAMKIKVGLTLFVTNCDAFFLNQSVYVLYSDIFVPGAYFAFIIMQSTGKSLIIHKLFFIFGSILSTILHYFIIIKYGWTIPLLLLVCSFTLIPSMTYHISGKYIYKCFDVSHDQYIDKEMLTDESKFNQDISMTTYQMGDKQEL